VRPELKERAIIIIPRSHHIHSSSRAGSNPVCSQTEEVIIVEAHTPLHTAKQCAHLQEQINHFTLNPYSIAGVGVVSVSFAPSPSSEILLQCSAIRLLGPPLGRGSWPPAPASRIRIHPAFPSFPRLALWKRPATDSSLTTNTTTTMSSARFGAYVLQPFLLAARPQKSGPQRRPLRTWDCG